MNNEEAFNYILLFFILLLVLIAPKKHIKMNSSNMTNLIFMFVCISLFFVLDKRIALLFLIIFVVFYYENANKSVDNNIKKIKEKFYEDTEAGAGAGAGAGAVSEAGAGAVSGAGAGAGAGVGAGSEAVETPTETTPQPTETTKLPIALGYSKADNNRFQQIDNLEDLLKKNNQEIEASLDGLKAGTAMDLVRNTCNQLGPSVVDEAFRSTIKEQFTHNKIPESIKEKFPNYYHRKEGFLKDYTLVPRNFKDNEIVKKVENLCAQNIKGEFDVAGCRFLDSKSELVKENYDTVYGPPLSKNNAYQSKDINGGIFYPLNE